MLERQHRSIKDSLKAALLEMAEKHEDKWLDHLPFVILGKNATLQPDIGASPSEMSFGMNVVIPGQILMDPGNLPDGPQLQDILRNVRNNTLNSVVQPSHHTKPTDLPGVPLGATHAYTRQHQTTGLQCPYQGPFKILEFPSKSTAKLLVGYFKSGEERHEIRHVNDLKFAHPKSLVSPAARPTLGRRPATVQTGVPSPTEAVPPVPQTPTETSSSTNRLSDPNPTAKQTNPAQSTIGTEPAVNHATSTRESRQLAPSSSGRSLPVRATRNPNPHYVDAISSVLRPWSATQKEILALNEAITLGNPIF